MFEKAKYENFSEAKIIEDLESHGYQPVSFTEKPNDYLAPHSHRENHILVVIMGEMKLKLTDGEKVMKPGDKITLLSGTEHEVWFGNQGCTYLWAEY